MDTLRADLVAEREERAGARRDLAGLRQDLAGLQGDLAALSRDHETLARERFLWEERYHALNGELTIQKDDFTHLQESSRQEIQRLYDEEKTLRAAVDDQTGHLGRTYAEIERLNGIIREMEATRAWRMRQWLGRRSS